MSDAFDEAKNEILRGSEANGGLTNRSLFDLIVASHGQTMSEIGELKETVSGRAEAIAAAKAEVMAEVESREHWPVLDAALEKFCAEMDTRQPRRASDPEDADYRLLRPDDEELGSMRRSWRIVRYVLLAAAAAGLIFWMDTLSRMLSHAWLGYLN